VRANVNYKFGLLGLAAIAWLVLPSGAPVVAEAPAGDAALSAAVCPIVYPVDQSASPRGAHFLFYGNGFFINKEGYLLTVAHVLSQLHGGQPYVLLRASSGPPRIVQAALAAIDRDHDIAILRVTPNPFEGNYDVSFLPVSYDPQQRGEPVLAAARRPLKPKDAYATEALVEERSPAEIYDFQFSQLDKGRSDTELFLFNHQVQFGQSGAPIVSVNSGEVIGLVEGQWLRSSLVPLTTAVSQGDPGVGAAIPIHYAIALLQQKGIAWQTASGIAQRPDITAANAKDFSLPVPLSLVPALYPRESLFGGEVVLDALIDAKGRVSEIKIVRGQSPFLEKVFSAVRTWTFFPALEEGHAVASRIGIAFQFLQSSSAVQAKPSQAESKSLFEEPSPNAAERGAIPIDTVDWEYADAGDAEGSVILYDFVNAQGELTSVRVLRDLEPLTAVTVAAAHQWRFVPGKRARTATDSATIVVFTFRRSGRTIPVHAHQQTQ